MAKKGKTMRQIREMLRLCVCNKMKDREVARAIRTSHRTVGLNLHKYLSLGLTWEEFEKKSDAELEPVFKKKRPVDTRRQDLEAQFTYIERELVKTGVTLFTLWEEYRSGRLFSYEYSQFCKHFQNWQAVRDVRMHFEHKAGDKLFVDFTGDKLQITDRETGSVTAVDVFVAALGCSQMAYIEAVPSQKACDWIMANSNALEYFGGSPAAIVPDNLRSGVTKSDRYEPEINRNYADFARHYGLVILPARVRKYRDKALVENTVRTIYQRVFAKIRNEVFYSIDELNERIWELLEEHNGKGFQQKDGSRRSRFEELERSALKPLPSRRFEYREQQSGMTVPYDYHVKLKEDKHFYSVPWRYHRQPIYMLYTATDVEIYLNKADPERIALHRRDRRKWGYTTVPEHMPSHHRFVAEWSAERFVRWAAETGPWTKEVVEKIMAQCGHPEQGFHMSMGVINLAKKFGKERLEMACKRAVMFKVYRYKAVRNILEKGIEREGEEEAPRPLSEHENIRGPSYYN